MATKPSTSDHAGIDAGNSADTVSKEPAAKESHFLKKTLDKIKEVTASAPPPSASLKEGDIVVRHGHFYRLGAIGKEWAVVVNAKDGGMAVKVWELQAAPPDVPQVPTPPAAPSETPTP